MTRSMASMLRVLILGVGPNWAPSYRQTLAALQRAGLAAKLPSPTGALVWQATLRGRVASAAYEDASKKTS